MFRVDVANKQLIGLTTRSFGRIGLKERFDIQEWIEHTPVILGEDLLIIAKEWILSSGKRLDLLAVDRQANLVVIELKRDDSGSDIDMQAIKYASYVSNFTPDDIFAIYAEALLSDTGDAQSRIEDFIETDVELLNETQRLILVAGQFHPEIASAVLWLRDNYQVDIKCIRLRSYFDTNGELFIIPDTIIPLPEAKDYIERKETKQREARHSQAGALSLEPGNFELPELERRLRNTLNSRTVLAPRFVAFLEILLSADRKFDRDKEIIPALVSQGIGSYKGQTGRYMSGISQFITKPGRSHLRQVIQFESDGSGKEKNNYQIVAEYRPLLQKLVDEWHAVQTAVPEDDGNPLLT